MCKPFCAHQHGDQKRRERRCWFNLIRRSPADRHACSKLLLEAHLAQVGHKTATPPNGVIARLVSRKLVAPPIKEQARLVGRKCPHSLGPSSILVRRLANNAQLNFGIEAYEQVDPRWCMPAVGCTRAESLSSI